MSRSNTIICIRWISDGNIEHFSNLGKLYKKYTPKKLGVSRYTLNKKNLWFGYKNKEVEIIKSLIQ